MRILVCGGRTFGVASGEADFLRQSLDAIAAKLRPSILIHGGQSGADSLAGEWAASNGVKVLAFPVLQADWIAHGRSAGPMRNSRMIREGKPDQVVAFPGDRGTRDMVRQARRSGIGVIFAGWSG